MHAIGNNTIEIQRKSYFKPNQNEGSNSYTLILEGLKQIKVEILKAVNMVR